MKSLDNAQSDLSSGDVVLIHFRDGNYSSWIYVGTQNTLLQGKEIGPLELLFADSLVHVQTCRRDGSYHKVTSSGTCPLFPGNPAIGYEVLKRGKDVASSQRQPKRTKPPADTRDTRQRWIDDNYEPGNLF